MQTIQLPFAENQVCSGCGNTLNRPRHRLGRWAWKCRDCQKKRLSEKHKVNYIPRPRVHSKKQVPVELTHINKVEEVRSLTDAEIQEAKALKAQGVTLQILAAKYSCSVTTMWWWVVPSPEKLEKKMKYRPRAITCHCGAYLKTHARCQNCTILLHDKPCDCTENKPYYSQVEYLGI